MMSFGIAALYKYLTKCIGTTVDGKCHSDVVYLDQAISVLDL